jgi:hypothetical protein
MKKKNDIKQSILVLVFSFQLSGCISTQVNYVKEPVPLNEASFFTLFDSYIVGLRVDGDSLNMRITGDFDFGSLPISPWATSWWYIPSGTHVIEIDYFNSYAGRKGTMSGSFNFQPGQYYEIYTTGSFNPGLHIRNISGYTKGGQGKALSRGEKRIAQRAGTTDNSEVNLPETWWARSTGALDWDIIYFLDENNYERYISFKSSDKETGIYQRNGDEIILEGIGKFQIRGGILIQNIGTKRIYFKRNNLEDLLLLRRTQ